MPPFPPTIGERFQFTPGPCVHARSAFSLRPMLRLRLPSVSILRGKSYQSGLGEGGVCGCASGPLGQTWQGLFGGGKAPQPPGGQGGKEGRGGDGGSKVGNLGKVGR